MKIRNVFDDEGTVIASELVFRFPPLQNKDELKKFIENIETQLTNLFNFEEEK